MIGEQEETHLALGRKMGKPLMSVDPHAVGLVLTLWPHP